MVVVFWLHAYSFSSFFACPFVPPPGLDQSPAGGGRVSAVVGEVIIMALLKMASQWTPDAVRQEIKDFGLSFRVFDFKEMEQALVYVGRVASRDLGGGSRWVCPFFSKISDCFVVVTADHHFPRWLVVECLAYLEGRDFAALFI